MLSEAPKRAERNVACEMLVHILVAVSLRVNDRTADMNAEFLGCNRVAIAVRAGTLPDNVVPR